MMATITHEGESRNLHKGRTIFDYADELAVQVPTSCGRSGICHECIVEVTNGIQALNAKTDSESFLRDDFRLACQAQVERKDIDIGFSTLRRTPKILTQTKETRTEIDPVVTRRGNTILYDGEEVDSFRGHIYGIAIDLGTTTIVMDLIDLETGETLRTSAFENPQRFGGSDVMHRISYDGQYPGELRKAVVNALNHEIEELGHQLGFVRQEVYEIVVAGNSTMRDILFRLNVQSIGQKPYRSLIEQEQLDGKRGSTTLLAKARRLGIRANPQTRVYGLPLIGSHVGGDVAADLLSIDMPSQKEAIMLVDVGTNTEVVVGHAGRLVCASCPAGPAFEGGLITYGMPGYEGAIESVSIENGQFLFKTIGDIKPVGICGSGLIDVLAELRRSGQMTPKGVFSEKRRQLSLVPESGITLSREDASNLAQAKAANFCGQFIVMRNFGIEPLDIHKLYLAGGFANYVDVRNAVNIGFLAPVPFDRIEKVGNASIEGSRKILLSRRKRAQIESLVENIEHIELETTSDFFEIFVEGCQFKQMPTEFKKLGAQEPIGFHG
ncbi:MAG: Na(+)-translocating NADH-quinone reductase subunit F [Candidatus Moanabacter tarae]|uniref:Na(+)-translocating NADH-quinone reductase subunit F n=1 Tax=Candidatus Moanibacter tarae TaxID=2200854 RepID=A0A2Z4ACS5_9BACT|nr:MAG: Na(+)-translocating NADH-quinone reductase subunit F [Candidatus Moanabacter tarae]|tara:strand:+ start:4940 stop:6598 length:1659 start_codon:yes stop_codon:yes gene_type:complete